MVVRYVRYCYKSYFEIFQLKYLPWSLFGIYESYSYQIHKPASSNHIRGLSDVACFLIVHATRYDKKVELIEASDH